MAIDFREMRDSLTPDKMGNIIPYNLESGQIAWSASGSEPKTLSARSEQISLDEGLASTYSCANCCPNVITDVHVHPEDLEVEYGDITPFFGTQFETNCYNQYLGPYSSQSVDWESQNTGIATIDLSGESEAVGVGYTTIHGCITRTIWYNWGGGHCEPVEDMICNIAPIEVRPRVTINVPATAKDGDTVTFSATTQGGTPTAYEWTYSIDSGSAGNNPMVNFATPTSSTTTAKAHWYARPNSDCATSPPAAGSTHPYYNSKYKIKVKVTFQGGTERSKDANFTVNAWWSPAGSVAPATNSGGIEIGFNTASQRWEVVGPGTMVRTTYPAVINVPAASQFYNKTVQHEAKHELQWQSGLFQNTFAVSSFMAVIANFNDVSAPALQQQINQAYLAWDLQQAQFYLNNLSAAEIEAYQISDLIAPQYAYQRCGRTTWP